VIARDEDERRERARDEDARRQRERRDRDTQNDPVEKDW